MGERKWITSKDLSCFVLFILKSLIIPLTMNGLLIYQAKVTAFPRFRARELQEASRPLGKYENTPYTARSPTPTAYWEKMLFQQKIFAQGCTKSFGIFTKCSQRPLRLPKIQYLYLAYFAYQIKSKLPNLLIYFHLIFFLPPDTQVIHAYLGRILNYGTS